MTVDPAAIAPLALEELARRRLGDFLDLMLPAYLQPPHVRLLVEHLEALEAREINRLLVTMPSRHGKTTHVSQGLPAWWLGRHPADDVILASHSAELAEANSRRVRGFLLDPRWPFEPRVSPDSAAVNRWNTTAGGGLIAAGVGGGITGFGADLIVIDDPVKDRADADSAAIREATWLWYSQVALTRLHKNAAVLLTQTRWHLDDLCGRVLNAPGADSWTVLTLPALAELDDALGRPEGAALWPDKYDEMHFEEMRETMGSRSFAALYQQQPTPAEGATFKRAWLDGRYDRVPDGARIVQAVDASFGKGVSSDFSAIVTLASDGRNHYVLHAARGRWDFHGLCQAIQREADEYGPEAIELEDAAAGQSAIQELKRTTGLPIIPVKPLGSKLARAEAVSPLFESERVFFPTEKTRWRDELIEELASFPAGRHDDQVDAIVYALERARGHGSGIGMAGVVVHSAGRHVERSGTPEEPLSYEEAVRLNPGWSDPRYE